MNARLVGGRLDGQTRELDHRRGTIFTAKFVDRGVVVWERYRYDADDDVWRLLDVRYG